MKTTMILRLTNLQLAHARRTIRDHYRMGRNPQPHEIGVEIKSLYRHGLIDLDDGAARLAARLAVGPHPIEIPTLPTSIED